MDKIAASLMASVATVTCFLSDLWLEDSSTQETWNWTATILIVFAIIIITMNRKED